MVSPAYWLGEDHKAYVDTRITLLIHDEIATKDLITLLPKEVTDYVETYRHNGYFPNESDLFNYGEFKRYVKGYPAPMVDDQPLDFNTVLKLLEFKSERTITVADNHEYGEFKNYCYYESEIGSQWVFQRNEWINRAARRTLLLTAENVPCEVARWRDDIEVVELDVPLCPFKPLKVVKARLSADTVKEYAENLQGEYLAKNGKKLSVISNKVSELRDTITHHSARGSNVFMARPIASIFTPNHPKVWAYLEALNAITGLTDMVRRRHLDELNQTIGRNWGFRYRQGAEHTVHMGTSLFNAMRPYFINGRYEMFEAGKLPTAKFRSNAKRTPTKISPALMALVKALNKVKN